MNTSSTVYAHSQIKLTNYGLLPKLARSHNSAFKPVTKPVSAKALRKTQSWLNSEKKKGALLPPFQTQGAQPLQQM